MHFIHDWRDTEEEWRPAENPRFDILWIKEECLDCVQVKWRVTAVTRLTPRVPDVAKSGKNNRSISGKRSAKSPRR